MPPCSIKKFPHGVAVPVKEERDLVVQFALLPAIQHQSLLCAGAIDLFPALHLQHSCCQGIYPCVASII